MTDLRALAQAVVDCDDMANNDALADEWNESPAAWLVLIDALTDERDRAVRIAAEAVEQAQMASGQADEAIGLLRMTLKNGEEFADHVRDFVQRAVPFGRCDRR